MKKLFLLLLFVSVLQTYQLQAIEVRLDLTSQKSLSEALNATGVPLSEITALVISGGTVTPDDFYSIKSLANLQRLDLSSTLVSENTIPPNALFGLQSLTSVIFPKGIVSIGNNAFMNTGLTSVSIPATVTSFGAGIFRGCAGLRSVALPEGITNIGSGMFYGCTSLTSVTVPASVIKIGYDAFWGCTGLTAINIAAGNTFYQSEAGVLFNADKTQLYVYPAAKTGSSYTIPASVTAIDPNAFMGCLHLTNLIVAGNATYQTVDGVLFNADKTRLIAYPSGKTGTSYIVPSGVEHIATDAFRGCTKLTSVQFPLSLTDIGDGAFYECTGLGSVSFPIFVENIGNYAFWGCTELSHIYIPPSVTSIGNSAFENCAGIDYCFIPSSVESFGTYVFSGCTSLALVTISEGLTSIPAGTFSYCTGLATIDIPASVTSIKGFAFSGCTNLASITIPRQVKSIEAYAFSGCTRLTNIEIPTSVESIGSSAFGGSGLRSVNIPSSVTSIGDFAFSRCAGLIAVNISGSVKDFGNWAFADCKNLTSVVISEGVTAIPNYAFQGCSGLTNISIPASVTSIGNGVFQGCSGLKSIYAYRSQPVDLGQSSFVFGGVTNCWLYVPETSVSDYRSAMQWKDLQIDEIVQAWDISLNKSETSLKTGGSERLIATVAPEGADKTVIWVSTEESVAMVDVSGTVTGVSAGIAYIIAMTQDEEKIAGCEVTVTGHKAVTGIHLNKTLVSLPWGSVEQLTAEVMPDDVSDKTIKWTTSDADVVTVTASGKLTGIKIGTAVVTATSADGAKAFCAITVTSAVTDVSFDKTEISVPIGGNKQLAATVAPGNAPDKSLTWITDRPDIAEVDALGKVTGVAPGIAIVTVLTKDGNRRATCLVTVETTNGIEMAKTPLAILYPNPTNGPFSLHFITTGTYRISLMDMAGKILIHQTTNDQLYQMDISDYPTGVYLLNIDDGKQQRVMKIMKE